MLTGEIALVSGASRGIGQAIAEELGRQGAVVVGTATTEAGAARISERLRVHGLQGRGMAMDVTLQASIDGVLAAVSEEFGAPSILVNNAAITRDTLVLRMKDEDWAAVIETNLTSVFRVSRACLKGMMKARRGRIISISSVVGANGNAGQANYAAAKAGMVGFAKSLAREVGARGITVNCVTPGFIDTDMTRALGDEQRRALLATIPLGRAGQPSDIAAVVAFLASAGAAYVTGETIHVNGGMYMA
jgi:3-oxoacyl-[acyl-carrier protein] reductase